MVYSLGKTIMQHISEEREGEEGASFDSTKEQYINIAKLIIATMKFEGSHVAMVCSIIHKFSRLAYLIQLIATNTKCKNRLVHQITRIG